MLGMGRDVDLGGVMLRPQRRAIEGPAGTAHVEPLVMSLLGTLARNAGRMVGRTTLFDACWPGLPIGDDSLNRLVTGARRALRSAADDLVTIETVPGAGYILSLASSVGAATEDNERAANLALEAGLASWRIGLPVPDWLAIERLKRAISGLPDHAGCWGMLALMLRHAAEYAEPADHATLLSQCEQAARTALALDSRQPEALVALISVVPIFGNWAAAHDRLAKVLDHHPDNVVAAHDLAIVEMASGRVRAAKALLDPLIAADPVAPSFGYKSTWHHWTVGDLVAMDQRADRMAQLWPDHPAVWNARFWTLAFTKRAEAAQRMLLDEVVPPPLPGSLVQFLKAVLAVAMGRTASRAIVVQEAVTAVTTGPAQAVISLTALGLLDEVDEAFVVAKGFYSQSGPFAVPIHGDPAFRVNEMRRRLTQVLFTPACAAMRADPRFAELCERIGLAEYWATTGRQPDYLMLG